ncbi:DNA polymerase III subunit alpha [Candidatus Clavichlamydia salmonicola]|uniref:DNA polymerase III subunit alpha n=1 Tax=Candidatus Clavichlamydia salmonicola TaxID=469812 RepID=UPI0018918266|nr:DNA polymerase III subunit alpha [Candidatus Clavichlamydia salmonicola]
MIHLHTHSQYSILAATASPEDLVLEAVKHGMKALALTDDGNLYGAIEFYKACIKHNIQPLLGCELYVAPESHLIKKKERGTPVAFRLTVLVKNEEGYKNLCLLSSLGFLEGFYYFPRVDKELLLKHKEGLIFLSGSLGGRIPYAILNESSEILEEELTWFTENMGDDFYLELQRHSMTSENISNFSEEWLKQQYYEWENNQKKVNTKLLALSKEKNIKCVATNDIHYINPEDWLSHEVMLNIQSGETIRIAKEHGHIPNPKRKTYSSREFYFKSSEEMAALFSDCPEALENTNEIASKCALVLDFSLKHYPIYLPPSLEGQDNIDEKERANQCNLFLRQLCEEALPIRYTSKKLQKILEQYPNEDPMTLVKSRLAQELDLIIDKGMCDYLLIVWDIINWAKNQHIPVGPGRGSGAGSIILFLIGITEIEPISLQLFFERFINPERISYPDIDIDLCMARREEVINYAVKRYGQDNVAQIITFGTMKAKMTVKDVGRTLDVPLNKTNMIAKYLPENALSLEQALEMDPSLNELYINDEEAREIIDLGKKLEGSIRNTGVHAAGVIISGCSLLERIPVCLPKESAMITTQYSMKPVEAVGMLKMDFLGLKTLTGIHTAIQAIKKQKGIDIHWNDLPLDDKNTFKLLHQGRTMGVFQMESGGMQELAKQLQPDKFEEIIAIGALYRPGPMNMIPSFINRKHKREPIEYDHPLLEKILEETYGIMVYQEQVMHIAQSLASYSLGEGDVLRRAMGKKDTAQMLKEREKFCSGAQNNGISQETATCIFDKMAKFASYGFNKSHAAAYGLLTYITAYLKANYTKEWLAALMTNDQYDIEKIGKLIREARSMNIPILPPDVNESESNFTATEHGIRFSMSGIKGIGHRIVELIIEDRDAIGPFTSLHNFICRMLKRMPGKRITKKIIENLIDSGCFDFTQYSRGVLNYNLEYSYDRALQAHRNDSSGVLTFFSLMDPDNNEKDYAMQDLEEDPRLAKKELLKKEKELLGVFLNEHPLDAHRAILKRLCCVPLVEINDLNDGAVIRAAFIIDTLTTKISSKGHKKFALLRVSDDVESFELPIWPDLYSEYSALLEENKLLYAIIIIDKKTDSTRLNCKWLCDLSEVNEETVITCDLMFDKIKAQVRRSTIAANIKNEKKQMENSSSAKSNEKDISTPLKLKIDLETAKMSLFLQIKEIVMNHPGKRSLILQFIYKGTPLANLITGEPGISYNAPCEAAIKKLSLLAVEA